ncbi:MAG: hypothetical protein ACREBB_05155, partial [Nitrosotalea sp.]
LTGRPETKTIDGSRKRENVIIRTIRSHPDIHHNGLKRLIVPRHMATKTFEHIIKDFIERKMINVQSIKNRKHYSIPLGFPDHPVKVHLSDLSQLVDEMRARLKELKGKYSRFPKNKKEQLALDLSHMYYDTRLQVIKIFELLGKERPVILGEYDYV